MLTNKEIEAIKKIAMDSAGFQDIIIFYGDGTSTVIDNNGNHKSTLPDDEPKKSTPPKWSDDDKNFPALIYNDVWGLNLISNKSTFDMYPDSSETRLATKEERDSIYCEEERKFTRTKDFPLGQIGLDDSEELKV